MRCFTLLFSLLLLGCAASDSEAPPDSDVVSKMPPDSVLVARGPVKTGARVLVESRFDRLSGKRVGLVTNHTAQVDGVHLIDLLHRAPNVELAALYGPEHGLRGRGEAGEEIVGGRDEKTGVPVFSLYGETQKPTQEMLEGIDVLVFDIQDIGARFYTYISTMGLAMQAAAEKGIPFVVLDRPNPLGGRYASGFVLDPAYRSFVGMYETPIAHGLTVGELARMIQEERLLPGLDGLQLDVVELQGWNRAMLWPQTGLPWVLPSPNIPDFETALVYPGAALFEATSASEGRGTKEPFKVLGAPWADAEALADTLDARGLPGVNFEPVRFTPRSIPGMASDPKLKGKKVAGVRYIITDPAAFRPVEAGIHVLHAFNEQARRKGVQDFISRPEWLAKLSGTDHLLEMLRRGARPETIIAAWEEELDAFRERRDAYLLYE